MDRNRPMRFHRRYLLAFVAVAAAAGLVPAFAAATLDPLFRSFQTFPHGQTAVFGRRGVATEAATGDFNGDGRQDIALPNRWVGGGLGGNSVSVLLHQGSEPDSPMYPRWTTFTVTGSDSSPVNIAVADLNGDGNQDIVTGNFDISAGVPRNLSVLYGKGNGTFFPYRSKALANYQSVLRVRDLNDDGRADVACLVATGGGNRGVAVMISTPDSLADPVIVGSSAGLSGFGIGDASGDGIPDLLLTYPTSIEILVGDNTGSFAPGISIVGTSVAGASMAHMNGDAILDIVQFDRDAFNAVIRMGTGFGGYQAPATVSLGPPAGFTRDLMAGDVDGDGDTDLIGYSNDSGDLSVRKNDGTGSFGTAEHYAGLPNGSVPTLVDVSQDSRPDIVVADFNFDQGNTVAVHLNDGSGGFPSQIEAIDANVSRSALGDFNRDGKLDLAYDGPNRIDIGFGNGNGTFTLHNSISTTLSPTGIAAADLNRDGKLDLVVEFSSDVATYFGAGDGTFTSSQTLAGSRLLKRSVADLNRDGRPDLVLGDSNATQLKVYLQSVAGTYGASTTYSPLAGASSVNYGDWNRDGRADIATTGTNGLSVYPGSAVTPGMLAAEVVIVSGTSYVDACEIDANRDGMPDLAGRLSSTNGAAFVGVDVFLGNGAGAFGAAISHGTTSPFGTSIDSWDANRDGNPDLVTAGLSGVHTAEVLLGGGGGTFGQRTSYGLGFLTDRPHYGDLNGDAMPDIVVASAFDGTVDTVTVKSTFATPPAKPVTLREVAAYSTINFPGFVAVGDLNRDGKLDAVAGSYSADPGIAVLLGNANGTLGASTTLTQARYGGKVALADLNRDGILDIAALDNSVGSQRVATFLGVGDGTFGARIDFAVPTGADFDIGDMNRDGIPDIVLATPTTVQVLLGTGSGSFAAASNVSLAGATVVDLDLADMDRDGDLDVVLAAGTVKIIYANALGTLTAPTTLPPPATECRNVVIADFNRDGAPDIIAQDGATYYEIWGALSGTPSTFTTRTLSFGAVDMKVGEAASDGAPYLFLTRNNDGLETFSVSTTGVLTQVDSHIVLQSPNTIALADMDRDGQVDVVGVGANNFITVNLHSPTPVITAVATPPAVPSGVALRQNYPNPFNPRTTIRYTLPRAERVQLRVFDVQGRLVATLRNGSEPAGERRVEWDGRDGQGQPVASGVYLYRLTTQSGERFSKRMVVVK